METNTQIVKVDPAEFGMDEIKANEIAIAFLPTVDKMKEFLPEFERLDGLEMTEKKCRDAKALRLRFVKVRTGTAAIHKAEKADYLDAGKYCDAWKNAQLEVSTKYENQLKGWEDYYERIEKARIRDLQEDRAAALEADTDMPETPGLGSMPDEAWSNLLAGARAAKQARLTAEEQTKQAAIDAEEIARKAREEAEVKRKAENARIEAENARLKKEAEEAEAKRQAEEVERKKEWEEKEKQQAFERAELQRKQDAERAEQENVRAAERAEEEVKLKAERVAKEKVEAELRAKQEAEAKAAQEAEAAQQAELQKGDAQKMIDLVDELEILKSKYGFESDDYRKLYGRVGKYLDRVISEIEGAKTQFSSKAA